MTRPIGISVPHRRVEDDDDIQDYKKPWVGLTDEDYDLLSDRWWKPNESEQALIDWVIERLKEKNT